MKITPYQTQILERLLCTSDGKITLQSMSRAIQLWHDQKNGVVTSQVMLLNEQSRLLSRGFSSGDGVISKEIEAEDFKESPAGEGMVYDCYYISKSSNHSLQVFSAA